jgi:hypothetical protein
MEETFSIDIISDLNLEKSDIFDWTGQPTSLFCLVAGGISQDIDVVRITLEHLSTMYRGVFYIDGILEHNSAFDVDGRIEQLHDICKSINNVIYMHNHVVILNGVALVAANGWFVNKSEDESLFSSDQIEVLRTNDLGYLTNTIRGLQRHKDAKKIVVMSSCAPSQYLMYDQNDNLLGQKLEPALSLLMDSKNKVSTWVFGGSQLMVDTVMSDRRFVNNPKVDGQPYWPKRILI